MVVSKRAGSLARRDDSPSFGFTRSDALDTGKNPMAA
jgi:hypothetical protein